MVEIGSASVAIASWNGRSHLETCLGALLEQRDPGIDWEILVLDNGSTDDTASWVEDWATRRDPRVRLLRSPVNLGFCAGNNLLVSEARGDAVAFVNNDTRPTEEWLESLVRGLREAPEDVAAVSGTILDWSGQRLDFARGILTFDGHAFQLGYHSPLAAVELPPSGSELLFPCGGNMLVRRASFLAAGGFDERYFAYLEDVDLGWRLWSGGERVTFVDDAVVHHRSMATSELLGRYNRGFLFERNALLTAYKNFDDELWRKLMPAILLTFLARTQAMLVGNNPGGAVLAVDPYAGVIANTGGGTVSPKPRKEGVESGRTQRRFLRRAAWRLGRFLLAGPGRSQLPVLSDERSVAQLQALSSILANLEGAAESRAAVQARRRRPDREILERFPLYVVPTYPGDEELFASSGFGAWLPADLPLVHGRLDEIMCLD
jgi:GT2 family glycosyltransferase